MMENLKTVFGYVLAGVILFLVVEEIKRYRKRKARTNVKYADYSEPVELEDVQVDEPQVNEHSRCVIY